MKRHVGRTGWVVAVLLSTALRLEGGESGVAGPPAPPTRTRGGILESLRDPANSYTTGMSPRASHQIPTISHGTNRGVTNSGSQPTRTEPRNAHPRNQVASKYSGRSRATFSATSKPYPAAVGPVGTTPGRHVQRSATAYAPKVTGPTVRPIANSSKNSAARPTPSTRTASPFSYEVEPIEFSEDVPLVEDTPVAESGETTDTLGHPDQRDLSDVSETEEGDPSTGVFLGTEPVTDDSVMMPVAVPKAALPAAEPTLAPGGSGVRRSTSPVPQAGPAGYGPQGYGPQGYGPQGYGPQQGYTLNSLLGDEAEQQQRQMLEQQFCDQMWNCAGGRCLTWHDRVLRDWRRTYESNWGGACGGGNGCSPPTLVAAFWEPILYPRAHFGWMVGMGSSAGCMTGGCSACSGTSEHCWTGFCADDTACQSCASGGCTSSVEEIHEPGCTTSGACTGDTCAAPLPDMVGGSDIFGPPALRTAPAGCASGACGN